MRNFRLFAVGIGGALGMVGLLNAMALAQAPDDDINPPVANCNQIPDTNAGDKPPPAKITATPITAGLLTSGQPCQQKVGILGLVPDDELANLQRGFDFYSWLTFIAMNSPADGKVIGKGPRPGGDAPTKWEDLQNYRPLANVMLPHGDKPEWGTRIVPDECKKLDGPGKIVFQLGEEAFNQPFKSGPLIDQDGQFALFDILMNHPMFDFILKHDLYSKAGQQKIDETDKTKFPQGRLEFPIGSNPSGTAPGRMGAIMLKVSYRILDPEKDKNLLDQFHTSDALIYFPGPPATKTGPACVEKKLGLVGFHVGHKTNFAPQWVWTSFEHVSNVPDADNVASGHLLPRYNFFNAACKKDCPVVNDTPPQPWDPDVTLTFHGDYKSQVIRTKMLPSPVLKEVAELNESFRGILKGTVWEYYMLLATQWPSDHASKTDPLGAPAPTYLANTTLETYSQGRVPLASSSCMACHGNATTHHVPATASDFTFILEKAQ
ncbi:MAG: hypothetical protein QOD11_369 [Bradyrhizobium sp.]|nr:hypothetical protein [Bradyrhizobium sp.]